MWNNLGDCAARRPCTALSPNATNRLLRARAGSLRIMRHLARRSKQSLPRKSRTCGGGLYIKEGKKLLCTKRDSYIRARPDEKGRYSLYIRSARNAHPDVRRKEARSLDHFGLFLPLGRRVFLLTAEEEEEKHADQQGIACENEPYTRPISHLEAVFVLGVAVHHSLCAEGTDGSPDAVGH